MHRVIESFRCSRKLLAFVTSAGDRQPLKFASRKDCQDKLFLCDPESKYRDISSKNVLAKEWAGIKSSASSSALALKGVEPLTVAFVREAFDLEGKVWSLPSHIFDEIRLDSAHVPPEAVVPPLTDACIFFDIIDGCSKITEQQVGPVFFSVRSCRPEKLKTPGMDIASEVRSRSTVELLQHVDGNLTKPSGVNVMTSS